MTLYRKKPITIEAVRLTDRIEIETREGVMVGEPGDWLITGVEGEKYPCKDSIFRKTYDPAGSYPPFDEWVWSLIMVARARGGLIASYTLVPILYNPVSLIVLLIAWDLAVKGGGNQ